MSKMLDLTDQRFGSWLVLEHAGRGTDRAAMWLCRCDCGGLGVVSGRALRRGRSSQCRSCAGTYPLDLSGQRFGEWVVLHRADNAGRSTSSRWVCRCSCGQETEVLGESLRAGKSLRCFSCARVVASSSRRGRWLTPDADVTYALVHSRLSQQNGPARHLSCVGCGKAASEWAYQHTDKVSERLGVSGWSRGRGASVPFSADLSHYAPMCHPCHVKLDRQKAKELAEEE